MSGSSMSFLLWTIFSSSCAGVGFCPPAAWPTGHSVNGRDTAEAALTFPPPFPCPSQEPTSRLQFPFRAQRSARWPPPLRQGQWRAGAVSPAPPLHSVAAAPRAYGPSQEVPFAHLMVRCRTWCMADTVFSQATCGDRGVGETHTLWFRHSHDAPSPNGVFRANKHCPCLESPGHWLYHHSLPTRGRVATKTPGGLGKCPRMKFNRLPLARVPWGRAEP